MRSSRLSLVLGLLLGFGAVAHAQDVAPRTTEDFIEVLKPGPFGDEASSEMRTRSLAPTTGEPPPPGTAGSGRVPDLQILFAFNSAELTPQARERLDVLGAALASDELEPFTFEIAGHTDAVGSPGYNLDLSRRRAEAVVGYLVQRWGIDRARLEAEGYGMTRLMVPNDGANARNRRVEVQTRTN
jgi:OmpA-OmpF porin, OOP family